MKTIFFREITVKQAHKRTHDHVNYMIFVDSLFQAIIFRFMYSNFSWSQLLVVSAYLFYNSAVKKNYMYVRPTVKDIS